MSILLLKKVRDRIRNSHADTRYCGHICEGCLYEDLCYEKRPPVNNDKVTTIILEGKDVTDNHDRSSVSSETS